MRSLKRRLNIEEIDFRKERIKNAALYADVDVPIFDINTIRIGRQYSEIAEGIHDRICESPTDIVNDDERSVQPILNMINFDVSTVIFCKAKKGGQFHMHMHREAEVAYMISGYMDITYMVDDHQLVDHRLFRGKYQLIDPYQPHCTSMPVDSFSLWVLIDYDKKTK